MPDRYFVDKPIADSIVRLAGAEAHHLIHVLRARPGTEVVLFDGSGSEFAARVQDVGRAEAALQVLERRDVDRELPIPVTLGVALPKGERQRSLVDSAVALGAARLVPLVARRGVAQPTAEARVRLARAVIEASKQCGRNRLMEIAPALAVEAFFQGAAGVRRLAHPGGMPLSSALAEVASADRTAGVWLAIGPEGGFTDEEVGQAEAHGWQTVDLGRRILRIETAACLLLATVAARWT